MKVQFITRILRLIFLGEWDAHMDGFHFVRKNLGMQARINIILQRITHIFRPTISLGIPYYITVEPASICNLRCPICPSGLNQSLRNPALLPLTDFKNMIDDIGDYLVCIQLWEWGEPFLNPYIYDMIAYAKKKGIIVISSTNAHFINKQENVDRLVASGLDGLILAVDGTTQEVYEQYRVGGKLDQVLDGIRLLVKTRRERKAEKPRLLLRMVINAFNEHQVDDFRQLGRDLHVDMVALKKINCHMGGAEKSAFVLPQEETYIRPRQHKGFQYRCTLPWCNAGLLSDGSICLCSLAPQGETALSKIAPGNSFRQIWQSRSARVFRKNMKRDHDYYPFCRNCDCREPDYQDSRFEIQTLS